MMARFKSEIATAKVSWGFWVEITAGERLQIKHYYVTLQPWDQIFKILSADSHMQIG